MPRQLTETGEGIPLVPVSHVMMQGIRTYGEEVERVRAQRTNHHYYTVSIRTRLVNREFRKVRLVKMPVPVEEGGTS